MRIRFTCFPTLAAAALAFATLFLLQQSGRAAQSGINDTTFKYVADDEGDQNLEQDQEQNNDIDNQDGEAFHLQGRPEIMLADSHQSESVESRQRAGDSRDNREKIRDLSRRDREVLFSLGPRERRTVLSLEPDEMHAFLSLGRRERRAFLSLSPWERGIFFSLAPREKSWFLALAPRERIVFIYLSPEQREELVSLPLPQRRAVVALEPGEWYTFITLAPWERNFFMTLGPGDRRGFLGLTPDERYGYYTMNPRERRGFFTASGAGKRKELAERAQRGEFRRGREAERGEENMRTLEQVTPGVRHNAEPQKPEGKITPQERPNTLMESTNPREREKGELKNPSPSEGTHSGNMESMTPKEREKGEPMHDMNSGTGAHQNQSSRQENKTSNDTGGMDQR